MNMRETDWRVGLNSLSVLFFGKKNRALEGKEIRFCLSATGNH